MFCFCFFFFSSRRRHTRLQGDWSSDVCSSDLSKHELLLLLVGGVFVLEALSVIFQVASFKSRGKRVFLMAPIHHHFELKGWEEPKVVVRLWIIAVLLALFSLSTLKLR